MRTKLYYLSDAEGAVRYVGKTSRSLHKRLTRHVYDSRKYTHYAANWLRSAREPCIELIDEVDGDGCAEEMALIAGLRKLGARLTNSTAGGEGVLGIQVSAATRAKLSAALKGRPGPMTGRKLSEEARAKISASKVGKKRPSEAITKMRASKIGKPLTALHKARIGAAGRGRVASAETRAKISAGRKAQLERVKLLDGSHP